VGGVSSNRRVAYFQGWNYSHPQLRAAWETWLQRHGFDLSVGPEMFVLWCDDGDYRVVVERAISNGTTEPIATVQLEAPALPFPEAHRVITWPHPGWISDLNGRPEDRPL
jgi:hypothetical protein